MSGKRTRSNENANTARQAAVTMLRHTKNLNLNTRASVAEAFKRNKQILDVLRGQVVAQRTVKLRQLKSQANPRVIADATQSLRALPIYRIIASCAKLYKRVCEDIHYKGRSLGRVLLNSQNRDQKFGQYIRGYTRGKDEFTVNRIAWKTGFSNLTFFPNSFTNNASTNNVIFNRWTKGAIDFGRFQVRVDPKRSVHGHIDRVVVTTRIVVRAPRAPANYRNRTSSLWNRRNDVTSADMWLVTLKTVILSNGNIVSRTADVEISYGVMTLNANESIAAENLPHAVQALLVANMFGDKNAPVTISSKPRVPGANAYVAKIFNSL